MAAKSSWASPEPPLVPLGRDSTVGDHGWVDDGLGILSCVAGHEQSATQLVACPYYLSHDVVTRLPGAVPEGRPTVTWKGHRYYKITQLASPQDWGTLVARLPADQE